jgi:hypothetical protein
MALRGFSPQSLVGAAMLLAIAALIGSADDQGAGSVVPVTIRIEIGDRSELAGLTRLVSIEDARGLEVRAVATPAQLMRLREAGYVWQILPPAAKAADVTMCSPGWEDDAEKPWSCYPSYDQYTAVMHRFAYDHPTLCRIVDLGAGNNVVRPHRLWAVVISDNPDTDEAEPEVLLTSTMHGDETTGYVLMLRLIDHLLRGYQDDPQITFLIDETEIWINPLANPDGAYFGGDDSVADAIRWYTTSTGGDSRVVNPNRNFPDFVDGDHPDGFDWWPETEAMMALAEAKTFVLSANFHGGVEVVNYPWDTVEHRHPDDLWFQTLARDWVDLAQDESPAGYMTDFENGITNGYDWYPIHGGRQDFMTFFHGGREVTVELSRTKLLPADELNDLWLWNRRALLDFIAHAQEGIRGVVTDENGTPLEATIEVLGVDREEDGSMVRTDPAVGDYHRLLLPGLYDLKIKVHGFFPHVISGVAVSDGEATVVDVVLNRESIRRPSRRVAPVSD